METTTENKAQRQTQLSLNLGLISLLGTPLIIFASVLWQFIFFHPLSPPREGIHVITKILFGGLVLLSTGMGVGCVITAFGEGTNPTSIRGKTAILLAVFVALLVLPGSAYYLYSLIFDFGP